MLETTRPSRPTAMILNHSKRIWSTLTSTWRRRVRRIKSFLMSRTIPTSATINSSTIRSKRQGGPRRSGIPYRCLSLRNRMQRYDQAEMGGRNLAMVSKHKLLTDLPGCSKCNWKTKRIWSRPSKAIRWPTTSSNTARKPTIATRNTMRLMGRTCQVGLAWSSLPSWAIPLRIFPLEPEWLKTNWVALIIEAKSATVNHSNTRTHMLTIWQRVDMVKLLSPADKVVRL